MATEIEARGRVSVGQIKRHRVEASGDEHVVEYSSCVDSVEPFKIRGWVAAHGPTLPGREALGLTFGGREVHADLRRIPRRDVAEALELELELPGFEIDLGVSSAREAIMEVLLDARDEPIALVLRLTGTHEPCELHATSRGRDDWSEFFGFQISSRRAVDLVLGRQVQRHVPDEPAPDPHQLKLIAYYLPQFHPFEPNNEWWGEGFTEWHNVASATANYEGHRVPNLPSDLGFYDLRVRETRRRQAELARYHKIDAFCYYYYWFSGRRIMTAVFDDIMLSGEPDLPFCICWANEPWSRRWDGSQDEVLFAQDHDREIDVDFIEDVLPLLRKTAYVRINGKPLLLVYRVALMRESAYVFERWRERATQEGFPGLHILACDTFEAIDVTASGVDGLAGFPPHRVTASDLSAQMDTSPSFEGKIYDYEEVVRGVSAYYRETDRLCPGVMPHWDNTPRKRSKSHIFAGSTPALFDNWLRLAFRRAMENPPGENLVFLNSWNEWAEGAQLEPSYHYGKAYLEALRLARLEFEAEDSARGVPRRELAALASQPVVGRPGSWGPATLEPIDDALEVLGLPYPADESEALEAIVENVVACDRPLRRLPNGDYLLALDDERLFTVVGWCALRGADGGLEALEGFQAGLIFESDGARLFRNFDDLFERPDVLLHFNATSSHVRTGYSLTLASVLPEGRYRIRLGVFCEDTLHVSRALVTLQARRR